MGFRWIGLTAAVLLTAAGAFLQGSLAAASHHGPYRGQPQARTLALKAFTWKGTPVSRSKVPLGDGHVSITPKRGYVDSCQTNFGNPGANGPTPWINHQKHTWNAVTKPHVHGSVAWPSASSSILLNGSTRAVTTNDLPVGRDTGTFPIQASDPAYVYDHNPNSIGAQSIQWSLDAHPVVVSPAHCVSLGPIGVTTDGVVFFDALDAGGRDAVAHEMQDACGGHPDQQSEYHYHAIGGCVSGKVVKNSATLVGYALDGFGIYVERDSQGHLPRNANLDACHGRTSTVVRDGSKVKMYHYDVTVEYPYTVGCYRGVPIQP